MVKKCPDCKRKHRTEECLVCAFNDKFKDRKSFKSSSSWPTSDGGTVTAKYNGSKLNVSITGGKKWK